MLLLLCNTVATAEEQSELPSVLNKTYKGYYHFYDEASGDSLCMIVLNPIVCIPAEKFKDKKAEEFYWRTVRDVRRTLPYAKLIGNTLMETYEYLETFETSKEKEAYMKEFEGALFKQYKPVMRTFTRSQGKMMMKLINRETNQSSFSIIKAFLGTFRAGFWYGFGRICGVNMKVDYSPDNKPDDAMIERICIRLEQGLL